MKSLVTGTADFIDDALALRLLERGDEVSGVDNVNAYYDPVLKETRLNRTRDYAGLTEERASLEDRPALERVFCAHRPQRVANLAARGAVRHSL